MGTKSTVISIKLPQSESRVLNQYLTIKRLSLGKFIRTIVERYIQLEDVIIDEDLLLIQQLLEQKKNREIFDRSRLNIANKKPKFAYGEKAEKEKLSVRIQKEQLKIWDLYCEKHFLTRTGLIRAAIHEFFQPRYSPIRPTDTEKARIKHLLDALVSGIGAIEEQKVYNLLNKFETKAVYQALMEIETEGRIGRKVSENNRVVYVSTGLTEESEEDPMLAHLLQRLL
jgi:hypothetical protein